jgi:hypothetical protein
MSKAAAKSWIKSALKNLYKCEGQSGKVAQEGIIRLSLLWLSDAMMRMPAPSDNSMYNTAGAALVGAVDDLGGALTATGKQRERYLNSAARLMEEAIAEL